MTSYKRLRDSTTERRRDVSQSVSILGTKRGLLREADLIPIVKSLHVDQAMSNNQQ